MRLPAYHALLSFAVVERPHPGGATARTLVSKDGLKLPEDASRISPSLLGLSATAEGSRLFATDCSNNSIKCIDLRSSAVQTVYKSDRKVIALKVLEQGGHTVCNVC